MRYILLVISLICFQANAQETFDENMYVVTIHEDTTTTTFSRVTFAQDEHSLCIKSDIIRCFTDLINLPTTDEYLGVMKSALGDKYIFRITSNGQYMTISLTNASGQYPHLIFTTRPPK